ncbi:hypothetical protein J6590_065520 [Homalodisca vitripennis]|nr:hypothetical protein J6590_065520 [Homalodisca vitripennis]
MVSRVFMGCEGHLACIVRPEQLVGLGLQPEPEVKKWYPVCLWGARVTWVS